MADLFVVIPVFNEEESLPVLWPELRAVLTDLSVSFEVAFVDDGSRDRSAEIIRAPAVRRLSSRIANRVRNAISDETIEDSGCTFRAFRRDCLRELVLYRGFHRFIPTLLRMRGYRVVEAPVKNRLRRFGRSKYGVLNRVVVATADLFVVRWMKSRMLRYEVAEDLGGDLARE